MSQEEEQPLKKLSPEAKKYDPEDYQFSPSLFKELQSEYGPFSLDLTSNTNGDNSMCTQFLSTWQDPRDEDLSGHNCWCNPPFKENFVCELLQHYLHCKQQNPHKTSACFVLPLWSNAAWQHLVSKMRIVRYYPKGTTLFTAPSSNKGTDRRHVGPTRWPVVVYRDDQKTPTPLSIKPPLLTLHETPPAQLCHMQTQQLMQLKGTANGKACKVLVDCGATEDFISSHYVQQQGFHVQGDPENHTVYMGNGVSAACGQTCKIKLKIQGYHVTRICHVTDLPHHEMVLGMKWLSHANPDIDFRKMTVTVHHNDRDYILHNDTSETKPRCEALLISAKQMCKQVKKGQAEMFLVLLKPLHPSAPHIPKDLLEEIKQVLSEYSDVFPEKLPDGLPPDRDFPHRIELIPGNTPPCKQPFRMSPLELIELRNQLQELTEAGYIQPSTSPYGAPVLFIKKKEGTLRMCIDYRALNKITVKNSHSLPRIDELLDQLAGSQVFSKLDLRSGYYQVPMAPEDVPKTAFRTRYGHYEFKVMPFGLTNAPATFQAMMNKVLEGYTDRFVANLLDDILIYSASMEEHVDHLKQVLQRLREHHLYAKSSKCEFVKKELEFVGYNISAEGLKPTPTKVKAVQEWPEPNSVKDIRSFLGFCNFYRRFIKGYAGIAAPLTELTKLGAWNGKLPEEAQQAFQALKSHMTSAPVLLNPDFTKPFVLHTDASDKAAGAILMQDQGAGLQPVAYESKKFSDAESRWTVNEKETFALVHACRLFRPYLESPLPFTVRCDNSAATFLFTKPTLTRKQARWVEELAQYNFTIQHISGLQNTSDALSRRPDMLNTMQKVTAANVTHQLAQQIAAA